MKAQTFNCPTCGAPLPYQDGDPATVRCPFCQNSVLVPPELRWDAQLKSTARAGSARSRTLTWVIALVTLGFILGMTLLALMLVQTGTEQVPKPQVAGRTPATELIRGASPTPLPSPSPTPAYARIALQFGSKGIGPGLLNDARYLGVDAGGTIYVADYQGGRVQAFDSTGKYLRQWKVGDAKTNIHGLAVSGGGQVYLAYGAEIARLDGTSGALIDTRTSPNGGEFGDLAVSADGRLAAAWYEGRWGIITSLKGHREDLVVFDPQGKIILQVPGFISAQTGDLALDNLLALDGLGNIYALSEDTIYKFSPEGKFIDRFSSSGNNPDSSRHPNSLAVDGQGRVFVGGSRAVWVLAPDGRQLADFPIDVNPDQMAFDLQGNLWIVSRDRVSKVVMSGQ